MPDTELLLAMLALLVGIGAFAGLLAGLLGVGGGIVLVPAYFYALSTLGYDGPMLMQICLATSLATIIVTSMRSMQSHHKKGAVDWDILKRWAPGIALGALAGVLVAASLRSATLQLLFGCLAIVIGLYLAFGKPHWRLAEEMPRGVTRAILSAVLGFLSTLMGIGGGSFGVPLMTLYGRPIHRAVATAAGFGLLIAVPSVLGFLFIPIAAENRPPFTVGAVNLPAFAVTIAMTLMTAPLGARLAHATDARRLRRTFAIFLLLVAANMLSEVLLG